jgi:hypothetical protein
MVLNNKIMDLNVSNKLIDTFLESRGVYKSHKDRFGAEVWGEWKPTEYSHSWEHLMSAVEAIEKKFETDTMFASINITKKYIHVNLFDYESGLTMGRIAGCYLDSPEIIKFDSKKKALYHIILEIAEWYSSINKPNENQILGQSTII